MSGLTALKVKNARAPGKYYDARGLYLLVKPSGSASWVLRTMVRGRRYELGLGSRLDVTLAEARDLADEVRKKLRAGATPSSLRAEANRAFGMTFAEAAKRVHTERLPGWKSSKAARQWLLVLEKHAFPKLGDKPISEVSSAHILEAVQPIWLEKQETARRVKQRIGIILDWGHAHNHRAEPAPMRAVDAALKKQKRSAKKHFAAMPYRELPEFLHRLDRLEGMGALGLRFLILTAARSGEVRGATWNEIDEAARTWTIPSDRMKAGDEHVVPLSDAAISILDAVKLLRRDVQQSLLFPGQRIKPMSDMTLAKALKSAGGVGYTVHGMRSSFRDWAAECTDAPHEVAEAALAHKTSDAVVRAYRRTDFFEKRRDLMIAWAHYLGRM